MRIGLFAADTVGHEIVSFFNEAREPFACLILDSMDGKGLNSSMRRIAVEALCPLVLTSDILKESRGISTLRDLELDLLILAW